MGGGVGSGVGLVGVGLRVGLSTFSSQLLDFLLDLLPDHQSQPADSLASEGAFDTVGEADHQPSELFLEDLALLDHFDVILLAFDEGQSSSSDAGFQSSLDLLAFEVFHSSSSFSSDAGFQSSLDLPAFEVSGLDGLFHSYPCPCPGSPRSLLYPSYLDSSFLGGCAGRTWIPSSFRGACSSRNHHTCGTRRDEHLWLHPSPGGGRSRLRRRS